jgi:hypothetical protein
MTRWSYLLVLCLLHEFQLALGQIFVHKPGTDIWGGFVVKEGLITVRFQASFTPYPLFDTQIVVCVICRYLSALSENTWMSWFTDYWPLLSGHNKKINLVTFNQRLHGIYLSVYLSICLSVCLSVCLCVWWWAGMSPWKQVKAFWVTWVWTRFESLLLT